jgi:hypothetical protein
MERSPVEAEPEPDAGEWIRPRLFPSWSLPGDRMPVGAAVPTGFEAYARILHPAARWSEDVEQPVRWSEIAASVGVALRGDTSWEEIALTPEGGHPCWQQNPMQGSLHAEELTPLVAILCLHTGTPQECQFALWEGYGGLDYERWSGSARLKLPGRTYVVLKGPIDAASRSLDDPFWQSPNLWWPRDLRWCVATEIDCSWTYVGASAACIEQLVGSDDLEALRVSAEDPAPLSSVGGKTKEKKKKIVG